MIEFDEDLETFVRVPGHVREAGLLVLTAVENGDARGVGNAHAPPGAQGRRDWANPRGTRPALSCPGGLRLQVLAGRRDRGYDVPPYTHREAMP